MYTRTIIYKVFSIVILIIAGLSFISSIISAANIGSISQYLPGDFKNIPIIISTISIILSALLFLLSYLDFSSMYVFADMIEYEKSGSTEPFKKKPFIFPAKVYTAYGNIVFTIVLLVNIISAVILVIATSIQNRELISLPMLPLLGNFLSIVFFYIQFLARFKGIGDLIDMLSANEPTQKHLENIQGYKTGLLRGYCVFLFVIDAILAIGTVIALIALYNPIVTVLGGVLTFIIYISLVAFSAIAIISNAVYGCFYDNLAKMIEHYQIKYNLIK